MQPPSITAAAIATVCTNAVAVAVAFGAQLSIGQQEVLLAFVGSLTSLVFAVYAAVHAHNVSAAVKLASSSASAPQAHPAPVSPGGGGV